jgi:thiol-disulfide isomerase/thioredoxin
MRRLIPVLLFGLLAPAAAADDNAPALEVAMKRAKDTGKPLILEFGTEWCVPCRMFEQNVLPLPEVQKALEDVTFVSYDAEKGHGEAAARRFGVKSFPTFMAVDEKGSVVMEEPGVGSVPGIFIDFLSRAASQLVSEDLLKGRLEQTPTDARLLLRAARWYRGRQRTSEALTSFDAAEAADARNELGVRADAAWEGAELRRSRDVRARMVKELVELMLRYPAAPRASAALLLATVDSGLTEPQVKAVYAAVIAAASPGRLNDIVYTALAAGDRDGALAAAQRALELMPKDARILDTVAEVHHYRGEHEAALAAADKALELAPPPLKGTLTENRTRFAGSEFRPCPQVEVLKKSVAAHWDRWGSSQIELRMPDGIPPEFKAQMEFIGAMQAAFAKVGQACAAKRGTLSEAYVRVALAENGGRPKRVTVLEPDASRALRQCLVDSIAASSLAKPAPMSGNPYTTRVPFVAGPPPGGLAVTFDAPPSSPGPVSFGRP